MLSIGLIISAVLLLKEAQGLGCIDESGKPIEWTIGIKLPDSFDYLYFDAKTPNWTQSDRSVLGESIIKSIMDSGFALNNKESAMFSMYNDEKSGEKYKFKYGHLKGMVAFDKNTNSGFWLIHSVPKLSEQLFSYEYPKSGHVYGQHFFCMSLKYDDLAQIVNLLKYSRPYIQSSWLGSDISKDIPDLVDLNNNKKFSMSATYDVAHMRTNGPDELKVFSFSKSKAFNNDLYSELVAKALNVSLHVETWQHGRGVLPSSCNPDQSVFSILKVTFKPYGLPVDFNNEQDHSKWAVSLNEPDHKMKNIVCLGDINREKSQFKRGGGTACVVSEKIWNNFNQLAKSVVPCP